MLKRLLCAALAAAAVVCPAHATVSTTTSTVSYTGNGATTAYSVPFKFLSSSDLVVKVNAVTKTLTTDYTVTGAGATSGGTVTFVTAPGNGLAVLITRNTPKTQTASLRQNRTYDPKTLEDGLDKRTMVEQELNDGVVVNQSLVDVSSATATGSGGSTSRTVGAWLADVTNAKTYNAKGDGSTDDSSAIASALGNRGVVYLPRSTTCYNIGTTGLSIGEGRVLMGDGMGGASAGPTCITYTGTGCAITLDSVSFSGVANLDLQLNTTSATARGICLKSTTGVAEFNRISSVSIRMTNATRRTAGQIALFLQDNGGNAVYWNTFSRLRFAYWDTAVKLTGNAGNGVNANIFEDLMSWGHVLAFTTATANVNDNRLNGLHCSRSDGTYAGAQTCVALVASGYGELHFTSDQGAPSTCATLDATSGGNTLFADCESGGPVTDSNATAFPNYIYQPINGAAPGLLTLGRLTLKSELAMGSAPSTNGDVRLSNNQIFSYRNTANSANMTVLVLDTSDRLKLGSGASFLRLDNAIVEHGSGTVANSGSERYQHNWTNLGRNNANNANRTIWSWGATADVLDIGDASASADIKAPLTPYTNGTLGTPTNGTVRYCSDCTIANPCAGGGTGALAKRLNGAWVCN